MTDEEFKTAIGKILHEFNILHRDALCEPSYEKVNQLVNLAFWISQDATYPKSVVYLISEDATNTEWVVHENTLTRSELEIEKARIEEKLDASEKGLKIYGIILEILLSGEDRVAFNRFLKEVARSSKIWTTEVSIVKGVGNTFLRSEGNATPLEKHLVKLELGQDLDIDFTQPAQTKGTNYRIDGELSLTGYILQHLEVIKKKIKRVDQNQINVEVLSPPFTWIKNAAALQSLSKDNLSNWVDVIYAKINEECGDMVESFDLRKLDLKTVSEAKEYFESMFPPFSFLGLSYFKDKEGGTGGKFPTYLRKKIKGVLKKIV